VARLIVIKGTDEGKQFELTDGVLGIGRDAGNQIRLTDTEVSRRHAELRQTPEGFRLTDKNSANGTFVNTNPIQDVLLQPGDHVQVGQSVLVYSSQRQGRGDGTDIAARIDMITRKDVELASAIVKTIGEAEGSRILARPDEVEGGPWLKGALANLGILYEATQAVNQIVDPNELLERIMDLVLKSIVADRGCIMLRDPHSGEFEPKVLRWRQGAPSDKMTISRSIMDHVLREKQGVLISDATQDQRFSGGESIVRSGIREVICVPMKGRHETLGVLYLDTRSTTREITRRRTATAKFNEDHLALAIALGHHAALAIETTRYYHAMVQAERLAAVGQTIAALSHHIKNILQGLRSGGDIVKMGLKDKDDTLLNRGWNIVEKNQAKIYDLVLDMLSYSKDREPAIETVDLNRIVGEVLELLQSRAAELHIKLETKFDANLPQLLADPDGVHRAVLNIIGNAFDAVDGKDEPRVLIGTSVEAEGGWARIVVVDNGNGVPADKMQEIFKPFVSTKGAKGTGLGLAVSRKILREHGGDITVQSQMGKGSRFVIRLPLRSPLDADMSGTHTMRPLEPPPES
jgi:signal transduction histidine kinase